MATAHQWHLGLRRLVPFAPVGGDPTRRRDRSTRRRRLLILGRAPATSRASRASRRGVSRDCMAVRALFRRRERGGRPRQRVRRPRSNNRRGDVSSVATTAFRVVVHAVIALITTPSARARPSSAPEIGGASVRTRACGAAMRRPRAAWLGAEQYRGAEPGVPGASRASPLREAEAHPSRGSVKCQDREARDDREKKPKKRKDKKRKSTGDTPPRKRERSTPRRASGRNLAREPVSEGTRGFFFVFFFFRVVGVRAEGIRRRLRARARTREAPRTRTPWTPRSASSRGSPTSARTWRTSCEASTPAKSSGVGVRGCARRRIVGGFRARRRRARALARGASWSS